jgi:DNA (cytosine-5)-methyltransferase 1
LSAEAGGDTQADGAKGSGAVITVGSLFSGIGGLDLGLEQAGMRTVWQVEYDDWARGKLDENFPHTKKFKDVREVGKRNLEQVDLIAGGFPCTDVSIAKENGRGLDGDASGLWKEHFRILCELRPQYALIENVARLAVFGLDRILCDLAAIGFNAEWQVLSGAAFGSPDERERLFIFAYTGPPRLSRCFHDGSLRIESRTTPTEFGNRSVTCGGWWAENRANIRMGDGLPLRVSRKLVRGYGNAVKPPVARWIGERIIEFDSR